MKWYPKARQAALQGNLDIDTADIRVQLVGSGYVQDDAHEFLSDVLAGDRIAATGALTSVTGTDGTLDAADQTINSVATGDTVDAAIVYVHTGTDATARLLLYIDKADDGTTDLALPTNGGNITVQFNAAGIGDI